MAVSTSTRAAVTAAAGVLCALGAAGCVRPRPPTITPRTVEVTQITANGLGLRVTVTANNPNRYAIVAQGVSAHVTLAGRDLGTTQSASGMSLSPHIDTTFSTELSVGWMDLPGLLAATVMSPQLPYHVEGTVDVGARDVRLRVPFAMDGAIPRAQVITATMNSVIPSLTAPPSGLPAIPAIPGLTAPGAPGTAPALPAIPPLPAIPGLTAPPATPQPPAGSGS